MSFKTLDTGLKPMMLGVPSCLYEFQKYILTSCKQQTYFCPDLWGAFTIYIYNARWVGGQKSGKFVNVYSIKIVNEGRWVVENM